MSETGTSIIRRAVEIRNRKFSLTNMASTANVSLADLDAFAHGTGNLPAAALQRLATEIWSGSLTYNADLDKLETSNKNPARFLGPGPSGPPAPPPLNPRGSNPPLIGLPAGSNRYKPPPWE